MIAALLVGSALLAAGPAPETLAPSDLAAYEAAKAGVGSDPDAHVRLAALVRSPRSPGRAGQAPGPGGAERPVQRDGRGG